MAFWRRWFSRIRAWWAPAPALDARSAMEALRQEKAAADPELRASFEALRNRLGVLVLSPGDRQRLWARARRREPGEIRPLDTIEAPTGPDLRALRQLVEELERGR